MSAATLPFPVLHYDSGFPTRLENHPRLAALLAEHGEPCKVEEISSGWRLTWWPLYPGLPEVSYDGMFNFWNDKRKLVRVSISPAR